MSQIKHILLIAASSVLLTHCEDRTNEVTSATTMSEEDAEYEFVTSTYDQINQRIRDKGWENIQVEQRHVANVIAAYSKIENAGFGGFYFDSEHLPEMLSDLAVSLEAVGAIRAKELLLQSTKQFEDGIVPNGFDARIEVAQKYPDDYDPFEDLDTTFYAEAEAYIPLLSKYIRDHPESFE